MPEGSTTTADLAAIADVPAGSAARPTRVAIAEAPIGRPATVSPTASAWRQSGLLFFAAFAVLLLIYRETVLDLIDGWSRTGTFAHGYIILPVSAWLVWRLRARLAPVLPAAQPLALVPLIGCGAVWIVGHTASVHATEQYAFVAMIPCLVWAVFGTEVTRRILFPLAFLFFAVPAGDFLVPTLMDHTADFTVWALQASGVPVFREGNFFSIPSGNWSVVDACSGMRYLIASLTLGCLFAYLNYRGAVRRAAFIVASLIVPIGANWLRAYMIVMIAHLSSNKLATGVDHLIYGWLFFGLVMLVLFWIGGFWRNDDFDDPVPAVEGVLPASARWAGWRATGLVTAGVLVIVAPWPALGDRLDAIAEGHHPGPIAIGAIDGWSADAAAITSFVPHYQRSGASLNTTYAAGDRSVDLFVAYYNGQKNDRSLITSDNDVVVIGDKVWGSVDQRSRTVEAGGRSFEVVEQAIKGETDHGNERVLTWRWYWINGRLTTSKYLAKGWMAFDKITGRGDDAAVVVVTVPLVADRRPAAEATLAAFVAAAEPRITAQLIAMRERGTQ